MFDDALLMLVRAVFLERCLNTKIVFDTLSRKLEDLLASANKQDLAHLVAYALEKNNLLKYDTQSLFGKAKKQAIYRYFQMDLAYEQICCIFENEEIPFIPLKGLVVRKYYPEPWMRTSCDLDILVKEADIDRAIKVLESQRWRIEGKKNYHDISLYSYTGVHLELHFHIKEGIQDMDAVLDRVWEFSSLTEGKEYTHRQSNEFLLFHLLAHMAYHFLNGGCGIRSVLDIWILRRQLCYDETLLQKLCDEAHLGKFYEHIIVLSNIWFGDTMHTPTTRYMETIILNGGVYGDASGNILLNQARSGSKIKNILHRLFMPYEKLKIRYTILEKYYWLTPIFQIVRWIQTLTGKRLSHVIKELKMNREVSADELLIAERFLDELGLRDM